MKKKNEEEDCGFFNSLLWKIEFFWVVCLENKRFKCVDFGGVCLESWKVIYYLMHNIHVR
jgi:hypothetical protein